MGTIIGSGLEIYIKRNARDTALNRVAEAERRAQEILAQAKQRIEIMQRDTQESALMRVEQNRRRLLAQADLSAKQILLARREKVMQTVWQQVEAKIRQTMTPAERLDLIGKGLKDAARQLGGGDLHLQVNAEDQALITQDILTQWQIALAEMNVTSLALAQEAAPIWGGVRVRHPDAHQLVDNSWNERLALARRLLRDQVYHQLTPDEQA